MVKKQKNKTNPHTNHLVTVFKNPWFLTVLLLYIGVGIGWFFYSFFQIDLNLTLINHPLFLQFQKPFIEFGYYQRELSVQTYIVLLVISFSAYLLTLRLVWLKKLSISHVGILTGTLCLLLVLAYPASFSHDIFNYMFDARIVTEYGQNPYTHKALDFPSDPWIRFMHWTHRTYPYGPIWLLVTIPLSFIGLGKFLIILLLFKLLILAAYVGITYFIYRILRIVAPEYAVIGVTFFALNPLVIVESLISAHNDILMMLFAVIAVYLLLQKKRVVSLGMILLSIGVKFTTIYLLPFVLFRFRPLIAFIFALITFSILSYRLGIQPWYFLWVMPFAAIACMHRIVRISMVTMTFVFLLRYIPFIESGSWYPSAIPFQYWATVAGIASTIVIYLVLMLFDRLRKTR